MNEVKNFAVFRADLPDDSKEANGDVTTPAGGNILEAICNHLGGAGVKTTKPSQHGFYGWAAEFEIGKVIIWLLLQQPGPWLLIVNARASWLIGEKTRAEGS